jgi:hypothetical protein
MTFEHLLSKLLEKKHRGEDLFLLDTNNSTVLAKLTQILWFNFGYIMSAERDREHKNVSLYYSFELNVMLASLGLCHELGSVFFN